MITEDEGPAASEQPSFEQLAPPALTGDFASFCAELRASLAAGARWTAQVAALALLRQVNKFFPEQSSALIIGFWPELGACLDHARPVVCRVALVLLAEVTLHAPLTDELIYRLEPLLAHKAFCDKKFLQAEARRAYDGLFQRGARASLLASAARTARGARGSSEELALKAVQACIAALGPALLTAPFDVFRDVARALDKALAYRRGAACAIAAQGVQSLWAALGAQNFAQLFDALHREGALDGEATARWREALAPPAPRPRRSTTPIKALRGRAPNF